MGFISMTEPSELVQKAIGRSNATWNRVKQQAVAGVGASACIACGFYTQYTQATTRDSAYPDLMPVPVASMSMVQNCYKGHFLKTFSCDASVV